MFPPQPDCAAYIDILALLRAAKQEVNFRALLPEVHAVAGSDIEPEFRNPFSHRLNVAEKSVFQAINPNTDSGSGLNIEAFEPFREQLASAPVLADQNFSRNRFQFRFRATRLCDFYVTPSA